MMTLQYLLELSALCNGKRLKFFLVQTCIILLFFNSDGFFCFLFIFQDAADNELCEEGDELDFDNDHDNDDEVDELALSFNDVEVCSVLIIFSPAAVI